MVSRLVPDPPSSVLPSQSQAFLQHIDLSRLKKLEALILIHEFEVNHNDEEAWVYHCLSQITCPVAVITLDLTYDRKPTIWFPRWARLNQALSLRNFRKLKYLNLRFHHNRRENTPYRYTDAEIKDNLRDCAGYISIKRFVDDY